MLRTVHVRTAFPTGERASTVSMYSESGRADASRSLFFVLSHPTHAERLGRLLPGFFKSPSGWRSAESLTAQIRAAVLEVERTSGTRVSLALVLVDAPRLVSLTRGDGVVGYDAGRGMRTSTRLASGRPLLAAREDGAGWRQWSIEPLPGHRFFVGLRDGLDRLEAAEVEGLGALVGREARAAHPGGASQRAAGRAGALVVGRINHVPWTSATGVPAAPEVLDPAPTWRTRAAPEAAPGRNRVA